MEENEKEDQKVDVIYFPRPPAYDPNRVLTPAQKERMKEAFRGAAASNLGVTPEDLKPTSESAPPAEASSPQDS